MLSDTLKSVQSTIVSRLTSPLAGSFALAWAAWNYRFIVVLFSDATISRTFQLIDTLIYPDKWTFLSRTILYPALSGAAYIFLYPYPARFVYAFTQRRHKELADQQKQISGEALMSIEDARQLRSYLAKREQELLEEVDRLNRIVSVSVSPTSEKKDETAAPAEQLSKVRTMPVSESQRAILMAIADSADSRIYEDDIRKSLNVKKIEFDYDIHALYQRKFITREDLSTGLVLGLTQNGRAVVLERA